MRSPDPLGRARARRAPRARPQRRRSRRSRAWSWRPPTASRRRWWPGPPHQTSASDRLQDLAGDHHALDLAGALTDLHQLGIAVHALDRNVAAVAQAAEDLDGLVGHPIGGFA